MNTPVCELLGIEFPLFFQPHYTSVNRFLASSGGHRSVGTLNEIGHLRGTRT